jgi:hypothetical protein
VDIRRLANKPKQTTGHFCRKVWTLSPTIVTRLLRLKQLILRHHRRLAPRNLWPRLQLERLEYRTVPSITISPASLPADTVSIPYSQAFGGGTPAITATGGTGAIQLAVSNVVGVIPGLVIPSSGTGSLPLSGTPTAPGTESFTVTATDGIGGTANASYTITVNAPVSLVSTTQAVVAASYFENAVYVIDGSSGALLQTLVPANAGAVLSMPAGITTGPDNNVYISSQANNAILQYNLTSQQLTPFIPSSVLNPIATAANGSKAVFAPAGLCFGPDGNLYVALNGGTRATSGGEIIRFNISNQGGQLSYANTFATVATGLIQPTELAFGVGPGIADNLYVSNSAAGNVVKITAADGPSPSSSNFISPGTGSLNYPSGLVWGPDGNLYVTDLGATNQQGQELVFSSTGTFLNVFTHPGSSLLNQFPSDAVFLDNGNLLTANLGPTFAPNTSGSITEFNPDGSFNQVLTSSAFPPAANGVTHISPTQITVVRTPPPASTVVLAPGELNVSYNQFISGANGTGPVVLAVSNVQNAIPGLTVQAAGITATVTGTPGATGTETFTLTATDAVGSTTSINYSVTILPPFVNATHFAVSAPATVAAGTPLQFTVMALDQLNSTVAGYNGTVRFTSSDSQATRPANATLVNGVGVFSATLTTAGIQTLTATDTLTSSISGGTYNITVTPATAMRFALSAPATTKLGAALSFTVTAQDQFYNTDFNYAGFVRFTSSDVNAGLPASTNLLSGVGVFTATLNTEGNQTISAYDTASNLITGRTNPIAATNTATKFVVTASANVAAGSIWIFTVTAQDSKSNTATSYTGTVHITSTDGQGLLPANATLTNGVGFFPAVLRTAGIQTLTATDTVTASIKGTSGKMTVAAAAASHFAVVAPASATTGSPFNFTVTALDPFNNVAVGYQGTVAFTSSDAAISAGSGLPSNYTFTTSGGSPDAGVHVFSSTFMTMGNQTISVADSVSSTIAGTSNVIAARGLIVTGLTPTSSGFVIAFNKPFDPSQVNLYDAGGAWGSTDVQLTGPGAPQISFRGSLLIDPSDQTITFVKTSSFTGLNFNPQTGVLAAGTYTVTLRSASNAFKDLLGAPLDGANNGSAAGSNYVATFVVGSTPAVVGIPSFARGPDSTTAINLPNTASVGIPLNLSVGSGVTSGVFTLTYNSALLAVTGAAASTALPGASLSLDAASTPGHAIIDFSSPAALTQTGVVGLGGLTATVPDSAAAVYKRKALLHWSGAQLNGGAIGVVGDDAVQLVAYLGDATGDGLLSGGDAAAISAVAVGTNTNVGLGRLGGFTAFPLVDPVVLGDVSANANTDAADVTLLNSVLSGTSRPQIPHIPTTLTITPTGPDPVLSMPTGLMATPGGTVVVPVNIDTARPDGSDGATEVILALRFDAQEFALSAGDIQTGTLTAGWQLTPVINAQTGAIGIDLVSTVPIRTTDAGSLVTITLHVLGSASPGNSGIELMNELNPNGLRVYRTEVADSQGAFILHPAVTGSGLEPGSPGMVTVSSAQPELSPVAVTAATVKPVIDPGFNDTTASEGHAALPPSYLSDLWQATPPSERAMLKQPTSALNIDPDATAPAGDNDSALAAPAPAPLGADWIPDAYLEYLRQEALRVAKKPDLFDGFELES